MAYLKFLALVFLPQIHSCHCRIFTFIILLILLFNCIKINHLFIEFCESSSLNLPYEHLTSTYVVEIDGTVSDAKYIANHYGMNYVEELFSGVYVFENPKVKRRSPRENILHLGFHKKVRTVERQVARIRVKRSISFNDPKWNSMWYLNGGAFLNLDMNVRKVWEKNITGKNIVISVLDDGIEYNHPDLKNNYDFQASYDYNNNDQSPSPRYTNGEKEQNNHHGTRCAGAIAAVANNEFCGVGVAFDAKIGGIRMLDGDVTDLIEAKAFAYKHNYIDIYSVSWGPDDNGMRVEGPARFAKRAFENGVLLGRKGLGSIYVWASGNGGSKGDDCNCDGYTNSIYTIGISSVSENAQPPWYSERCSSIMAVAFSSNKRNEKAVITSDLYGRCIDNHTGTSASAPLATGICALTLSANNELTWRDMQHLIVRTARSEVLFASDWSTNRAGYRYSHSFGFGLMDAHAMVELALNWSRVPDQLVYEVHWRPSSFRSNTGSNFHGSIFPKVQSQQPNFLHRGKFRLDLKSRKLDERHAPKPTDTSSKYYFRGFASPTNLTALHAIEGRKSAASLFSLNPASSLSAMFGVQFNEDTNHNQFEQSNSPLQTNLSPQSDFEQEIHPPKHSKPIQHVETEGETMHNNPDEIPLQIPPGQRRTFRVEVIANSIRLPSGGFSKEEFKPPCRINFLEHVQVKMTLISSIRGQVSLRLVSPTGSSTQLLHPRRHDLLNSGFYNWPFMSVHFWGEQPHGIWSLIVDPGNSNVKIFYWTLIIYGTATHPYEKGNRNSQMPRDNTESKNHVPREESSISLSIVPEKNGVEMILSKSDFQDPSRQSNQSALYSHTTVKFDIARSDSVAPPNISPKISLLFSDNNLVEFRLTSYLTLTCKIFVIFSFHIILSYC